MFDNVGGGGAGAGARLGSLPAVLRAELGTLEAEGLEDAALIDALSVLEVAKAACAAAQARLTERFVAARADRAARLRADARACAEAGDFDGWVLARDRARTLELDPEDASARWRGRRGRRGSSTASGGEPDEPGARNRSARRLQLSRTGVAAEVALARRESPARGSRLASASVALVHHLPRTLEALAAGVLNERRAELVVRATSHLDPAVRARVDAEVIGAHLHLEDPLTGVGGWGDRELERRVRACADRLDAQAAVERSRVAESERRVTIRPVPDTMALVTAVLPVAQAVAVHAALTRAAASAKAAGDARGKGQVMADTLVQRLTGQATATGVPIEVQLVMTDRALLAGDDTPAHVPGYGPVPAGWARDLLTRATTPTPDTRPDTPGSTGAVDGTSRDTGDPGDTGGAHIDRGAPAKAWVRRLFTHPDTGTLVAMDSTRRLFPAALRRFVIARDGTCRTPWCDAPVAHLDHITPHATGGATSAGNGQGLCIRCNLVKEHPDWHARVTRPGPRPGHGDHDDHGDHGDHGDLPHTVEITTPTGHRYTSTSPPVLPMTAEREQPRPAAPPAPHAPDTAPTPLTFMVLELYRPMPFEVELAS